MESKKEAIKFLNNNNNNNKNPQEILSDIWSWKNSQNKVFWAIWSQKTFVFVFFVFKQFEIKSFQEKSYKTAFDHETILNWND